MAYSQNTITSANAANDLATVLDGLLIAAGWSVVETLTPSGTFRNKVYKSSGASNLCGYDWYFVICWNTVGVAQNLELWAGQAYNTGTHVLTGQPVGPYSLGSPHSVFDGLPTTGFISATPLNMSTHVTAATKTILSYNNDTGSFSSSPGFQTICPVSAFGYWASITLDHVALWTTIAGSQDAIYSTLILDAGYSESAFFSHGPIVLIDSNSYCISSHFLGVTPASSTQFTGAHLGYTGATGLKLPALTGPFKNAQAWKPYFFLDYMKQGAGSPVIASTPQIKGGITIGQVPDFLLTYGGSLGDTVNIGAQTYVLSAPMTISDIADVRPTILVLVEP